MTEMCLARHLVKIQQKPNNLRLSHWTFSALILYSVMRWHDKQVITHIVLNPEDYLSTPAKSNNQRGDKICVILRVTCKAIKVTCSLS